MSIILLLVQSKLYHLKLYCFIRIVYLKYYNTIFVYLKYYNTKFVYLKYYNTKFVYLKYYKK